MLPHPVGTRWLPPARPGSTAPMAWMYILECSDGSFYVGSTRDLARRLQQHQDGRGAAYTRRRLPVRLAYSCAFDRVVEAFAAEKQVQGWSRAKRQALIDGDFDALGPLARKDFTGRDRSPCSGTDVLE